MSEREARDVLGVARETWVRLRDGMDVRPSSLAKMTQSLTAWVDEHGLTETSDTPVETRATPAPELFEFTMTIGALDLQATAKGRPEDADLIREQVTKAISDMMRGAQGD